MAGIFDTGIFDTGIYDHDPAVDITTQPGGWLPVKYVDRKGREVGIDAAKVEIERDYKTAVDDKKASAERVAAVSQSVRNLVQKIDMLRAVESDSARIDYMDGVQRDIEEIQREALQRAVAQREAAEERARAKKQGKAAKKAAAAEVARLHELTAQFRFDYENDRALRTALADDYEMRAAVDNISAALSIMFERAQELMKRKTKPERRAND